jgi:hypothetical protein
MSDLELTRDIIDIAQKIAGLLPPDPEKFDRSKYRR